MLPRRRPNDKHELYYRPGGRRRTRGQARRGPGAPRCRIRVHLETRLVSVALNEHVFWMHLRFFMQMYWLEGRRAEKWAEGLQVAVPRRDGSTWRKPPPVHKRLKPDARGENFKIYYAPFAPFVNLLAPSAQRYMVDNEQSCCCGMAQRPESNGTGSGVEEHHGICRTKTFRADEMTQR
ncbi:hypothetical protein DFH07DRAFT_764601 [Mycena maculata]|uniref:Uncharacterized protein n=1 Tax=Mycena maculata TaxID=230809 RepID=A0AAD7KDG0_9AGAR|nr:hypothetical protein DFH07DRAFT_764601 [Mycena maculata]